MAQHLFCPKTRRLLTALFAVAAIWPLPACAQTSQTVANPVPAANSHAFQLQGDTVTLQFDPKQYGLSDPRSVVVRGSFTSWSKGSIPLVRGADGRWSVTRSRNLVDIPGNSGQPEFKFVVNDSQWIGADQEPVGYRFTGNFVLLFAGDSPADIAGRDQKASLVRDSYDSPQQLGNFRELQGGRLAPQRLYRSYHPFIASRPQLSAEASRLLAVQALAQEHGIRAVLNMADALSDVQGNAVPSFYQDLVRNDQVLLDATSYEDSYFQPEGAAYAKTLQQALGFIANHPGPYLIHCRLGTDRTGVMSAVIEAFMGVPWATIAADFDRSNELGIREYRHPRLLAYAFQRMLGDAPERIPDLAAAMRAFLVKQGVSAETLDQASRQLSN